MKSTPRWWKEQTTMDKKLERNLANMPPAERTDAISQLHQIEMEIKKYSKAYFWSGRGKARWETQIRVELGTDVIDFYSKYYETKRCYYTHSLTLNGEKIVPAMVAEIMEALCDLNAQIPQEPIFLDDDIFL